MAAQSPDVEVKNDVGCGDALLGGLLYAYLNKQYLTSFTHFYLLFTWAAPQLILMFLMGKIKMNQHSGSITLCACGDNLKCEGICREKNFEKGWGKCPAIDYGNRKRQTRKRGKAKGRNSSEQLHTSDSSRRNRVRKCKDNRFNWHSEDEEVRGSGSSNRGSSTW